MRWSLSFTLVALLLAACSNAPQEPAWTRIDLPADGTVVLSEVADCGGQWWAVGAVRTGETTRPAAWTGPPWRPVSFAPRPESYYGPRQVIRSVACAGDRVVLVGATPGGAHGSPRVSTWHRRPDGSLAENAAPFETYGGDEAVDVGPIAAGPAGFAIAGNRTSGAAAWFSPDGTTFTLSQSGRAGTAARDVVALPGGRWLIVGTGGWTGSWARDTELGEMQRAVRDGDDVLAAGLDGADFQVWRRHDGEWRVTETFPGDPRGVRSLAVADGRSVVAGGGLWIAGERREAPAEPVAVAARGSTVLLASDDSLWQTTVHR
ncbi:hypothetical protein [Actinoplanes sp. M2I2]|uniref:hypothetical protein n=1 Tax=Actinoplanes sp. M2I2 TaxID=1734444 RepID=UPI00202265E5|nr:hypothetical protein [Actinoplanes sp. M2I2]